MSQAQVGGQYDDDFSNNLNRLANDCRARLLSASQYLVEETNRLESILKSIPEDPLSFCLEQLTQSRTELLRMVDGFYAQAEESLRAQYAHQAGPEEIETRAQMIFERIAEDQKAINEFSRELNSKDKCLEGMQAVREADFDGENQTVHNQINQYAEFVKSNQVSVVTEWNMLDTIFQDLNRYVSIQNQPAFVSPQHSQYQPQAYQPQTYQPQTYQPHRSSAKAERPEAHKRHRSEDPNPDIVYQHSPMKMGGNIPQKGSRKPHAYKYEVQSPDKHSAKRDHLRHTPNGTESSRRENSPSLMRSVDGTMQPVSMKKEHVDMSDRYPRESEMEHPRATQPETFSRHGPVNDQGPVVVFENWFEGNHDAQLLHFFQDNSKKLHILDLKKAQKNGKFRFEEIELDINFKIPIWHRSIITKQGFIYLTGGSGAGLANDKNLNDVYVYDPIDHSLRPKAKMIHARNSHGICLFQDHIYVVGGCLDEEGYTTHCERYQISKYYEKTVGEWEEIACLNKAAYAPCLASFNDTYLYKFGGIMNLQHMNNTIERYDPRVNKWTEITYNIFGTSGQEFSLMAYAGCIQVSEDEIYIFGGSTFDTKSSQTYVCRTNNKAHVVQKLDISLPARGTFWNNSVIFGGKIYTLQTVQLNKSDAFFLSKRRLLCYSGEAWQEVPTSEDQH